jgi:non-heme chloroperoxidase
MQLRSLALAIAVASCATMKDRSIDLPGRVTLRIVERGDARGPAVVLLHGFADSWRSFERVLPHFPPSLHVVAVSQRGHGDSGRPEEGYGVPDLSADLVALLDALAIERAVIAGHSMGSAVALRFAIDHPERARSVVLIGAAASLRATPEARAYWDGELAKLTDPIPRDFLRSFVEQSFVKSVPREPVEAMIDESAKVPLRVWRAVFEARWRAEGDYAAELPAIRTPTLILWGDRDPRYPRSEQDALLAEIQGSRLAVFEGAGHMLHVEEPERCAREIVGFVAKD